MSRKQNVLFSLAALCFILFLFLNDGDRSSRVGLWGFALSVSLCTVAGAVWLYFHYSYNAFFKRTVARNVEFRTSFREARNPEELKAIYKEEENRLRDLLTYDPHLREIFYKITR
jgi:hypothetical protein